MTIKKISGCMGCGICVATCPTDVIHKYPETGLAFIKYPEDYQMCHLWRKWGAPHLRQNGE